MQWNEDVTYVEMGEDATTRTLRKNIMTALFQAYPVQSGWPDPTGVRTTAWVLDIKYFPSGGVLTLRNLWISGKMGVTIPLKPSHETIVQDCVKYAGELFERYGVSREKGLKMREELLGMPRHWSGEAIQA